jgi:transposase
MAYSMDYRKRAVAYRQAGHTFAELKDAFGIPPETYYQWNGKLESGYYENKTKQVRKRKIDKEELKKAVAGKPDAFLRELAEPFNCTPTAVFLMLKKCKITRKKRAIPIMKSQKRNAKNI